MIIGILGSGGCGGTFLDWSLHYLLGSDTNLVIECDPTNRSLINRQYVQTILSDPLSNKTAHGHLKTHPDKQSVDAVIGSFRGYPGSLHTFYYVESIVNSDEFRSHNKIIKSYPDLKFINYNFNVNDIDIIFCLQYEKISIAKKNFNKVVVDTLSMEIDQIAQWDIREILSLYYPKCIQGQLFDAEKINYTNSFSLDCADMFFNLESVILNIAKFLDKTIDLSKWQNWVNLYQKWQQRNNLDFFKDLNTIIDGILTNQNIDLDKYNMTFAKEIVIAKKLLYEHNLSLKSFGLKTIPTNTQAWHSIIEENVYHNIKELT